MLVLLKTWPGPLVLMPPAPLQAMDTQLEHMVSHAARIRNDFAYAHEPYNIYMVRGGGSRFGVSGNREKRIGRVAPLRPVPSIDSMESPHSERTIAGAQFADVQLSEIPKVRR